jgi:hypothetical protein
VEPIRIFENPSGPPVRATSTALFYCNDFATSGWAHGREKLYGTAFVERSDYMGRRAGITDCVGVTERADSVFYGANAFSADS